LDVFVPHEYGYAFKVIFTNRKIKAKKVLVYHNGRGAQESVFGELKSQGQMDHLAVRRLWGNRLCMLCAILAHNLFLPEDDHSVVDARVNALFHSVLDGRPPAQGEHLLGQGRIHPLRVPRPAAGMTRQVGSRFTDEIFACDFTMICPCSRIFD